jgi:tetratricopeptide (TPR) repeat protein
VIRLVLAVCIAASLAAQSPNWLEQADAEFRQGDFDRAGVLAQRALARDPSAVHGHMILGVIAAQKKQWAASNRHFLAVVRLDPSNPYGYFYLGQAKLYQQQWNEAIQFFSKALQRKYPEVDRLLVELAVAQNEAGLPKQALETLGKTSPSANPQMAAQFHAATAFAQAKLNQFVPAIEAARRALQSDPTPHVWELLIDALIQTDQAPRALAEAILAQRKFPDHPDIQFLFVLASYHVTESPLSGLALRNLRESDPASPRVLLAEGLLHRKEGRNEEATTAFRQAAARGVPHARLLLGILLRETGDEAGAEREYRAAERFDAKNGQLQLEFGKMLLSRGDFAGALERLKRAAESMPSVPQVHYQLGIVYRRLQQTEEAERHFQSYRQLLADRMETATSPTSPLRQ